VTMNSLEGVLENGGEGDDMDEESEEEIDLEPFRSERSSAGYRGVSWDGKYQKLSTKYRACISVNGTTRSLGAFDTAEEAARAFARVYLRKHKDQPMAEEEERNEEDSGSRRRGHLHSAGPLAGCVSTCKGCMRPHLNLPHTCGGSSSDDEAQPARGASIRSRKRPAKLLEAAAKDFKFGGHSVTSERVILPPNATANDSCVGNAFNVQGTGTGKSASPLNGMDHNDFVHQLVSQVPSPMPNQPQPQATSALARRDTSAFEIYKWCGGPGQLRDQERVVGDSAEKAARVYGTAAYGGPPAPTAAHHFPQKEEGEEKIDLEPFRLELSNAGYRGVRWDSSSRKYFAAIWVNGHVMHLGNFGTVEEAAQAFARAYLRQHGGPPALPTPSVAGQVREKEECQKPHSGPPAVALKKKEPKMALRLENGYAVPEKQQRAIKTAWRKYGQKLLVGRSSSVVKVYRLYFKCNQQPGCGRRRQVEVSKGDAMMPSIHAEWQH